MRDPATGFCIECGANEVGEAVGRIDPADPRSRFDGYSKSSETEKKLLRDVFEKGDVYFRTGDLLKQDAEGYFYFIDRIGDTFRWKGENVATSEVGEALSVYPGVKEANVYGVRVGALDGSAGMAAVVAGPESDLAGLPAHLEKKLPAYARPIFLRCLRNEMEITGTFKHRKGGAGKGRLRTLPSSTTRFTGSMEAKTYQPLDPATYLKLASGEVKL